MEKLNPKFIDELRQVNNSNVGIIAADFMTKNIAEEIVKISSKDNSRWLTTNGRIESTITQTNNEQEASYWKIKQLGNNKVALHYMGNKEAEIKDSNLSLNICGGYDTEGTKAILYPSSYDSDTNQQFILEEN